jgi:integrase
LWLNERHFLGQILGMDFSGKLAQVNGRLKASRVGVTVEQHGGKLRLRATLPPKPGSTKTDDYQQRISIGLPANLAGLREAEREARLVGAQLASREFSWARYLGAEALPETKPCERWVNEFHRHYIQVNGGKETTWQGDYAKVLKKLPPHSPLTPQQLETLILKTKPNTKSRVRACMVAGAIAKFARLEFDPKPYRGNYSPAQVTPRNLPSDQMVAKYRYSLTNPAWRWVYGMMATYGLRNHEVFHLDLSAFPIVQVLQPTKTGSREVWPCFPEWADEWGLRDPQLPNCDLNRPNDKLGHTVTEYLSPKLPFSPYDLRHAWAVRTLEFGWPDALSAQQMGHSLEVHNRTYQRWINTRHHQRVYDLLVNRPDRPRPPAIDPKKNQNPTSDQLTEVRTKPESAWPPISKTGIGSA